MRSTYLVLLIVIVASIAGAALGQLKFPDASEQTTAYSGATGGGSGNTATDDYCTVGGGLDNQAGDNAGTTDDAMYATVGGGYENTAGDSFVTVGGGGQNTCSGSFATVGGGYSNLVTDYCGTIGGGGDNQAGDNAGNTTDAWYATVGGGQDNTASGIFATVPGGRENSASGDYSFAAGRLAIADDDGSFVLADSTNSYLTSMAPNRMTARFVGGYLFYTDTILTTYSYLAPGSGTWADSSDRAGKENVRSVDTREVLDKLARIPIATWNYKTQDQSIRHMGPMAQDLHAAFGLGESDTHITTVDADGVALAAIQGLYETVQEKDARIEALQKKLETVEARLDSLTEN